MSASPELLRHVALRRAASAMASAIMDDQYDAQDDAKGTDAATLESVRQQSIATSKAAQSANPALAGISKSEAESKPAWVEKNMSDTKPATKEAAWQLLQVMAVESAPKDGSESVEQGIARVLNTPLGSALYTSWKVLPWSESGHTTSVVKAEDPGSIRAAVAVQRQERLDGLTAMAAEAASKVK